ncbi:unnamed protein product [Rotaria sp. Silwood2]|nr:unnamed protein product [Rotaria sp. Silwood2]CAF2718620.1 unnamed protein product [Rotaria sp. Silwood2]CAF2887368.1 unnamed protein product [Rotaria sp. Silwood2]CAF4058485.1 unnamed protein product [Rotaria sp. Silwood2]CAF4152141.1 unnamed protein product [Rotaria sp. Silwood2]
MQLAIALYNNDVDDEDELEFRKGDILTVLIENPNGLNGWWLCEHKGKCGLCPGNRLKLISNTISSTIKSNEPIRSPSRLSTASIYDSLSNDYDIPITALSSSNHDYDIPQGSDFISNSCTPTPIDSSPESSSRSSGIYSTVDLRLSDVSSSSLSSESHTSIMNGNNCMRLVSSINIDQLQDSFRKLSINSLLLDKYRQLISNSNIDSINRLFIHECQMFLHDNGCLLDRHTYKIIKQNLLYELEHVTSNQRIIQLATQIIQLIKPIIELRLKQKHTSFSTIPIDVFKKLNLEPIEELTNENENKKMTTSMSTTQIYRNFQNNKSTNHTRSSQMPTSKTCHSNFLTESNHDKSDDYDYIDDDYSISPSLSIKDPLIKCYHRHIREHISSMFMRYARLLQFNQTQNEINNTSFLINESKALIVAGHKLVFVLETLHEHLQHSTKNQHIETPLIHLTRQLSDALTLFVRSLKQFSNQNCTNIQKFQHDTQMIMNVVKRIKQQCSSV